MYKLFKKPLLYLAGVGIGLGILSSAYTEDVVQGKNFLKGIGSLGVGVMRTFVGGLTGYDIVKQEQGLPIVGAASCGSRAVFNAGEYAAGSVLPLETHELSEDGKLNEAFDEAGILGRVARSAIVGGGVGLALEATTGIEITHDLLSESEAFLFGAGVGSASTGLEETVRNWDDLRLR